MTGGEIIPAAAHLTGKAAAKALREDDAMKKELIEAAKATRAFQAAADSYARRVAVKQFLLLKLYEPLARMLGASKEYFESPDGFAKEMAEKVADIPEEHLTTPAASLAMPAMQGLGWTLEEPNLKEMYLNLLATATDDRRATGAHPAYAEIIKQLAAEEAEMLAILVRDMRDTMSAIVIVKILSPTGWKPLTGTLVNTVHADSDEPIEVSGLSVWIDNWVRLGLVELRWDLTAVKEHEGEPEDMYDWVEARPEMKRLRAEHGGRVSHRPGALALTTFGRQFADAVGIDVGDADPAPDTTTET